MTDQNADKVRENPSKCIGTRQIDLGAGIFTLGVFLPLIFNRVVLFGLDWFQIVIFLTSYLIIGADILFRAGKKLIKGQFLNESLLISVATIIAFTLGFYMNTVLLMLIFQVGEYLQGMVRERSKPSIGLFVVFMNRFSRYITLIVYGCALLMTVIPPLFCGALWNDWMNRGLLLLIVWNFILVIHKLCKIS